MNQRWRRALLWLALGIVVTPVAWAAVISVVAVALHDRPPRLQFYAGVGALVAPAYALVVLFWPKLVRLCPWVEEDLRAFGLWPPFLCCPLRSGSDERSHRTRRSG